MNFDDLIHDLNTFRSKHGAYPLRWLLLGGDFDAVWKYVCRNVDRFRYDDHQVTQFKLLTCTVIRVEELNIPGPIRSRP